MKSVLRWLVPSVALACLSATPAFAQQYPTGETGRWTAPVRAPNNAFELTLGTGYTQGFGRMAGTGTNVDQLAREGAGFSLGAGYRMSPRFSLGVEGQYQEFRPATSLEQADPSAATRGMSAGLLGTVHFRPYETIDPFLSFGTGYRTFWEVRSPAISDTTQHGWQVARLAIGADVRLNEHTAIAPVVGADLTAFAAQYRDAGATVAAPNIRDWGMSTFLFAGFQGRFDIGGERRHDTDNNGTQVARR